MRQMRRAVLPTKWSYYDDRHAWRVKCTDTILPFFDLAPCERRLGDLGGGKKVCGAFFSPPKVGAKSQAKTA
jgi:hypothetical protein